MSKETEAPGPDRNGQSTNLTREDVERIRPLRTVPGVMGRAAWFAERAGRKPDALSTERLRTALNAVDRMLDAAEEPDDTLDRAHELVRLSGLGRQRPNQPVLIEANGRVMEVAIRPPYRKKEGLSAVHGPIEVPDLQSPSALLFIPVDDQAASYLDLDEIVGAELTDRKNIRLSDKFRYLSDEGLIVGRVERSGVYQVFALPKHPWLRLAIDVLCKHWKWVVIDPVIHKGGAGMGPGIIDRICQLVLCAPDYNRAGDRQILSQAGIGSPPGFDQSDLGLPPSGSGSSDDICERCLGDFLGEIDMVGGLIIAPPIVKWCLRRRPRCSRWVSIGPFPAEGFNGIGRVTQLDIHPSNGNHLIAGAAGGGVWRTDNSGTTWRPLMDLQPTLTIGAVAIAPSNPKVMYAASGEDGGGWNPAWGGVGVYRTSDGGRHWALMSTVPSTRFSALIVHPADPNTIYAAGNMGLHKSDDGGAAWITNPGLASLFDAQITDIVIAHDDPDQIFIGVRNDGVYRSTTAGEQDGVNPAFSRLDGANQLPSGAATGWVKLTIGKNGANGSNFVAAKMGADGSRIFRTIDGGNIWAELAQNVASVSYDEWCSLIAVDPNDQDVLYAGAAGALARTTNGGLNIADWTSINVGVHADQQDIVFDPDDSSRIFLANDGGVYRSNDQGDNWEFASGRLAITQFYDIDIAERDKDIVAGGAQDNGIYYRNDTGVWRHIPWGDGTQVAIDPTDPQIFYFSSQNGLPAWLRKSVDGGASHQQVGQNGLSGGSPWITIIKLDPTDPIVDPANNRIIFVCGTNVLFRSNDGGQNWQRVDDAGGNPFTTSGTITALEFGPSNPSILYLGTSTGAVYRAINGGVTAADWSRIDTAGSPAEALFPNSQIQAVRVNPKDADDVWVVFGGAGVSYTSRPDMILNPLGISHLFRSTDAGQNWMDASGQFPALSLPDVPTSATAISDMDAEIAYVGTDAGAFRTTDGGLTWTAFQEGLPRSPIVELRYHRRYDRLFAATMGRGIYVRDV